MSASLALALLLFEEPAPCRRDDFADFDDYVACNQATHEATNQRRDARIAESMVGKSNRLIRSIELSATGVAMRF